MRRGTHQIDIIEDSFYRKYDVVSSISTLQQKPPFGDPNVYLERMIAKMFEISTKCVVFDIFSSKFAEFDNPNNMYVEPTAFLHVLYQYTNRLTLFNNYNPYQLMVVLFKERLSGWKGENEELEYA